MITIKLSRQAVTQRANEWIEPTDLSVCHRGCVKWWCCRMRQTWLPIRAESMTWAVRSRTGWLPWSAHSLAEPTTPQHEHIRPTYMLYPAVIAKPKFWKCDSRIPIMAFRNYKNSSKWYFFKCYSHLVNRIFLSCTLEAYSSVCTVIFILTVTVIRYSSDIWLCRG